MNFDPGKVFENLVSFYARLPLAQKIALPLLMVGSMSAIVFVTRWAGRPEYQVVFSGMEQTDAAGVVEYLKDKHIDYKLSDEGRTVAISPPTMVDSVRLELSSAGLPKGSTKGFELFDKSTLGTTALAEQITKLRAIQGELERTIMSIDAVKAARVHLNNPEKSAFVKKDSVPTAAVLLKIKAGMELTPAQVKGIAHLVAGSVERLTVENVTIMDSKGNLLNEKSDGVDGGGADLTRLDYQRQIESAYVKRIETMLDEVLGPNKSVARVTVDMDFSKFEKEEEAYDPSGIVTRSERTVDDGSGSKTQTGVPGVSSNLTNDTSLLGAPDSGKGASAHRESVKNYEVSRAVSRTAQAAGRVQRVSVAVLVDGQYVKVPGTEKGEDGKPLQVDQYRPLATEMMRKIENLVKQSVGFDGARGDSVTVENIRFMPNEAMEEVLAGAAPSMLDKFLFPNIGTVLLVLFFFLFLIRPLVKFLTKPTESEVDLSRLLPSGVEELEAELDAERVKLGSVAEVPVAGIDMEELEGILAQNSKVVKDNPQQAALLIRYWLNDGRI